MKKNVVLAFLIFCPLSRAQNPAYQTVEIHINELIDGTLLLPDGIQNPPLAILIAGSGPTDRNGNQPMLQNNSLKYLAEGLSKKGMATFRYDKRIIKQIKLNTIKEEDLLFEDFIDDAQAVINYFHPDFTRVFIIGHSEGSLIGMVAAQENAVGFISLSGAGRPIDDILKEQIGKQAPNLVAELDQNFTLLKEKKEIKTVNPILASLFRPTVQPYMRSWVKYNPAVEIAKLNIPVLIVNGNKDLQVSVQDAELLAAAKTDAQLAIIDNMNHILKNIEADVMENQMSYNKKELPVSEKLIEMVVGFIGKN
ncbi:MAG: alpha/beta hydrolase [Flavobacteriales bacterium CG_4_9_14_3_um_filter_40_17]|nr:MAG: alpha/beta hydrolase [Flavobacteriales bacterium CG_4_9_14_3_um_filter_40_17]